MVSRGCPIVGFTREGGQASLLLLGVLAALLAGTLVLFGLGQALGSRGKHQRAADLAAVSAAQVMRDHYPRLFEPAVLGGGSPPPLLLAAPAPPPPPGPPPVGGPRRNGVPPEGVSVEFPDAG